MVPWWQPRVARDHTKVLWESHHGLCQIRDCSSLPSRARPYLTMDMVPVVARASVRRVDSCFTGGAAAPGAAFQWRGTEMSPHNGNVDGDTSAHLPPEPPTGAGLTVAMPAAHSASRRSSLALESFSMTALRRSTSSRGGSGLDTTTVPGVHQNSLPFDTEVRPTNI